MILIHKDRIFDLVCSHIMRAKDIIYATQSFSQDEDIYFSESYYYAINRSQSQIYKRFCFGDSCIVDKFIEYEKNIMHSKFLNIYTNAVYQRLIIIDDLVFFKVWEKFYCSADIWLISVFKRWFETL